MCDSLYPVSYTHLDVYKRQLLDLQVFRLLFREYDAVPGQAALVELLHERIRIVPVSYTHLTFKDPQPSFNSPIAKLVQDYPIKSCSVVAHIRQANPVSYTHLDVYKRQTE